MSRWVLVTNSKFRPVDYCTHSRKFGAQRNPGWVKVKGSSERDRLLTAQAQHYFAYIIRQRLDDRGIDISDYAQRLGVDQTRLYRVLNGTVLMRLEDVATAHRALGHIWDPLDQEGDPLA